jgi:hypothetical protein
MTIEMFQPERTVPKSDCVSAQEIGSDAMLAAAGHAAPSTSWKPLLSEDLWLSMARVTRAASGGRRPLTAAKLRKFMLP